ncbi:RNA polymerase sigma-70 factor [Tamlana haliotis]|uniref:RNA polymerase sigma-70 factor n=1 Tax=Pseudotamlana haliotis TaxID=2614804 RepID=A0A6N6MIZ5_9FLAO|nr:RNA polymerase sigma-70 factor [Tamlana haliotis]KAB1068155.1 RNA polymerase sigma-70 factor [Tamlana haliotis]
MKNNTEDLQLLILNFKKGNTSAFKYFFEKYHSKLTSFINSYTNNPELTQDIVQDAFVTLWESRDKIDSSKSIAPYLYKIAYNIFINNYRKHVKESKMLDALMYKTLIDLSEEDTDLQEKKLKQITEAIEILPPKCKKVFQMSKLQGYKYAEIAIMLNISVKTVEAQMGKAFAIIRERIKKTGPLILSLIAKHIYHKTTNTWHKYLNKTPI